MSDAFLAEIKRKVRAKETLHDAEVEALKFQVHVLSEQFERRQTMEGALALQDALDLLREFVTTMSSKKVVHLTNLNKSHD